MHAVRHLECKGYRPRILFTRHKRRNNKKGINYPEKKQLKEANNQKLVTILEAICTPYDPSAKKVGPTNHLKKMNLPRAGTNAGASYPTIISRNLAFLQKLPKPQPGIFHRSLQGFKIDIDQSESCPEAFVPLEIIGGRPNEITVHVHSFVFCFQNRS